MNVNDVKGAAEDLVEGHGVSPLENVHVQGVHGAELINGFDIAEVNEFAGVFVLDSSGKPAVSSRVVAKLEAEIERLTNHIEDTEANCVECGDYFMPKVESSATLYYCGGCREKEAK